MGVRQSLPKSQPRTRRELCRDCTTGTPQSQQALRREKSSYFRPVLLEQAFDLRLRLPIPDREHRERGIIQQAKAHDIAIRPGILHHLVAIAPKKAPSQLLQIRTVAKATKLALHAHAQAIAPLGTIVRVADPGKPADSTPSLRRTIRSASASRTRAPRRQRRARETEGTRTIAS